MAASTLRGGAPPRGRAPHARGRRHAHARRRRRATSLAAAAPPPQQKGSKKAALGRACAAGQALALAGVLAWHAGGALLLPYAAAALAGGGACALLLPALRALKLRQVGALLHVRAVRSSRAAAAQARRRRAAAASGVMGGVWRARTPTHRLSGCCLSAFLSAFDY